MEPRFPQAFRVLYIFQVPKPFPTLALALHESFMMIHRKKSIVHLKELLLLLNDTHTIVFRSYLIWFPQLNLYCVSLWVLNLADIPEFRRMNYLGDKYSMYTPYIRNKEFLAWFIVRILSFYILLSLAASSEESGRSLIKGGLEAAEPVLSGERLWSILYLILGGARRNARLYLPTTATSKKLSKRIKEFRILRRWFLSTNTHLATTGNPDNLDNEACYLIWIFF